MAKVDTVSVKRPSRGFFGKIPSEGSYFSYIYLLIASLVQIIIFGILFCFEDVARAGRGLENCKLLASLEFRSLDKLRIVAVVLSATLILDALLDVYSYNVVFPKIDSTQIRHKTGKIWKELTIRCMVITTLLESNLVMLAVPQNASSVIVYIATMHIQNSMIFCTSFFIISYAFPLSLCQRVVSVFMSSIFAFGQFISFIALVRAWPQTWHYVYIALEIVPPLMYISMSLCLCRTRYIRGRASGAHSKLTSKEIVFMISFILALTWYILKFASFANNRSCLIEDQSAETMTIYDDTIIMIAIVATILRAWFARQESKKAQILISMTKRNVIENLTYPLLEISVGLNILLASVNKEAVMDVEGKNNLSRLALACNTAINALDDMAYEDECLFSHLDLVTERLRSSSFSKSRRNFDLPEIHSASDPLPSAVRIRSLRTKYRTKEGDKSRVVSQGPNDYDSEVSEIYDVQSKLSAMMSAKSVNNMDLSVLSCPPPEQQGHRPFINLLATSIRSQSSVCEDREQDQHHTPPPRLSQQHYRSRPKPNFNSFYCLDEKNNEDDSSEEASAMNSSSANPHLKSTSLPLSFPSSFGLSPMPSALEAPDKYRPIDVAESEYKDDATPINSPVPPHSRSQFHSQSQSHSLCVKPDPRSPQSSESRLQSCSALDPYSSPLSVISSAMSCQLIVAPCTPLQLYRYMPDSGSVGFECPFSYISYSNPNLLDLLGSFSPLTSPEDSPDTISHRFSADEASKKSRDGPFWSLIPDNNVPRKVFCRSVSALANSTFTPIRHSPSGSDEATFTPGAHNPSRKYKAGAKCDMLSLFTWNLLQAFYCDLKTTFDVYEVLLSSFSEEQNFRSGGIRKCVSNALGVPSNNFFKDPSLLGFDALCDLEEYLSGTLALFVKSSASLLAVVDNVAVMKERRRRGIF